MLYTCVLCRRRCLTLSVTTQSSSTAIVAQVAYETDHASSYFLVDSIPTTAALTAVLVHARAVLTRARDVYSESEWRSHGLEGALEDSRRSLRRHVVVDGYDLDNA